MSTVMSTAKRPLADDCSGDGDTVAVVKAARTGGMTAVSAVLLCASAAPLFAQTLRTGVFSFLSTRDAFVLLRSCKAFWQDTELAEHALRAEPSWELVQHLGTKCSLDWFWLTPRRTALGFDGNLPYCDHMDSLEEEAESRADGLYDDIPDAFAKPVLDARLLSAVTAVNECIIPAQPGYRIRVNDNGRMVFTVPVMIPLRSYHPDAANLPVYHDWRREDVRVALNALREGFGDDFVDDDPAHAFASAFGLHWDNTHLSSDTNEVECALCEVAEYIHQHDAATRHAVHNNDATAKSALDELRASALGQKFVLCESTLFAADRNDRSGDWEARCSELLRAMGLTVFPYTENGIGPLDVRAALSKRGGYSHICARLVQPLKQFLLQHCTFTRRMAYDCRSGLDDACDGDMDENIVTELLAGVMPSGYLCGVYFVRNVGRQNDDW